MVDVTGTVFVLDPSAGILPQEPHQTDDSGSVPGHGRSWNQQTMWAQGHAAIQGWRTYFGPDPHTDHVHFSFS